MTADVQRELFAAALGDEPPFASGEIARDAIRSGRRRRLRRRFMTGVGAVGLAVLAAGAGYSVLPGQGASSSITVADRASQRAQLPQLRADRSAAADLTLQRLLEAEGLKLGSRHGFGALPAEHPAAAETLVRGGFNVVGGGSVDIQITHVDRLRCIDPACQTLPDGRGFLVMSETVPGHPGYGVTTVSVFEGDGRIASVSMRNYPLTSAGQMEATGSVGSYPLSERQLVDLAAERAWAQASIR